MVAKADAEHRDLGRHHALNGGHGVDAGGRRVARPIGQEHAIGLVAQDVVRGRVGWDHRHAAAGLGQRAQDVALGAVIHGDDVVARPGLALESMLDGPSALVPLVALRARHLSGQVHALQPGPGLRLGAQGGKSNRPSAGKASTAVGGPPSRMRSVIARVSTPGDAGQAVRHQPGDERLGGRASSTAR